MKNNFLINYWEAYRNYVKGVVLPDHDDKLKDLSYWRNELFYNLLIYIAPLSIIALVPSVYMSFWHGAPVVGIFDILVFLFLIFVMVNRSLTLSLRKIIFVAGVYILSIVLIYYLSNTGVGRLFLLTITIITALIYSPSAAFYSAWANTFICFVFAALIYFKVNLPITSLYSAGAWVAISSNLILLSFVCAQCLNLLLKGLERYIADEKAAEANLNAIIENTGALIYSLDTNYRYITFNRLLSNTMKRKYSLDIKTGDRVNDFLKNINPAEAREWERVYGEAFIGKTLQFVKDYSEGNTSSYFSFSINPIWQNEKVTGLSVFSRDITTEKKAEQELIKVNRLFHFISAINQNIVHTKNEQGFLTNACSIATKVGGFTLAWIGLLDEKNKLNIVAESGNTQILQTLQRYKGLDYNSSDLLNSQPGKALQSGKPVVNNFVQQDPDMVEWKDELGQLGIKSRVVYPLKKADKVIGLFCFYADTENFFDEQEIKLLEEAVGDISFALEVFEKERIRVQLEDELHLIAAQQKSTLNALPAQIALLDMKGTIIAVNEAWRNFARTNGVEDSNYFVGSNYVSISENATGDDEQAGKAIAQGIQEILKGSEEEFMLEYPCHSPTEHRWFQVKVAPSKNGNLSGAVVMHINITDRKKAEQKLVDSEQQYRLLAHQLQLQHLRLANAQAVAKVGSWETEFPSLNVTWSDEAYRIFGTNKESFDPTHEGFLKFVHPLDRDKVDKAFRESAQLRVQGNSTIEHLIITPEGEEKVIEEKWKLSYDQNGEPLLALGSCQDITERKKAETLLQESENKFRSLIENSVDLLSLINADGLLVYTSPSIIRTFGFSEEENKLRPVMEVMHPDDIPLAMQTLEKVFKNPGVSFPSTVRNLKKDGAYIWVEGTITNMLEVPGVHAIVANFRDITERKKAGEQQALFSNIVNSSYDAILSCNFESVIYSWNTGAEKMFGFTASEIIGKKVYQIVPPHLKHEEIEILEKIKKGEVIQHYETEREKKNGERIFVSITASAIKDSDGNIIGTSKILRDITESKKNEEKILLVNERLQLATSAANVGIWDYHIENNNLIWDENMYRLYGISAAEFSGAYEAWESGLHPDDLKRAADELKIAIQGGNNFDSEFRVVWPDKTIHYIKADALLYRDKDGIPVRLVGTNRDITESKKAEEEIKLLNESLEKKIAERTTDLQHSNDEMKAFTYSVSHDLRAPLRAINGFSTIIMKDYSSKLDEEGMRLFNLVVNNATKMGVLIDDLLSYSRVGQTELSIKLVDITEHARIVAEELKQQYPDVQTEMILDNTPKARCDAKLMKQVLQNLLGNALKYSANTAAPKVHFGSYIEGAETVYYIKDNGAGFDMRYSAKLFTMFQRLHSTTQFEGTGVGLAIVKRIIQKHGGRIWAEAEVDKGATFYFTLKK